MKFPFFGRRKQAPPEKKFAYFPSQHELEGLTAIQLKEKLEERLQVLADKAKTETLTPAEQTEKQELEERIQNLLQSGQISPLPAQSLSSRPPHHDYQDWVEPQSEKHRILIIEDDAALAEMLQYCLSRLELEITVLQDGKEAETWVQTQPPPQLVSLDLMLPRSSGLHLIELIRQQANWEEVPILVHSSKSDEATIQEVLKRGANEYVVKPIQPDAYVARVQNLLGI